MSGHVDAELLRAFAMGDIEDEERLIAVAEHLDACPLCATRADQLDPVAFLLEQASDIEVPADLAASVLRAIQHEERPFGMRGAFVGMALLGAAGILALWPGTMTAARAAVAIRAPLAAWKALSIALAEPSLHLALSTFFLLLAVVTAAIAMRRSTFQVSQ